MTKIEKIIALLEHNKDRIGALVIAVSALPKQKLFRVEEDPATSDEGGDQMVISTDTAREEDSELGQMVTAETRGLALIIHQDIGISRREYGGPQHDPMAMLAALAGRGR